MVQELQIGGTRSATRRFRRQSARPAGNGYQQAAFEQALGDALGIVERDGIDHSAALVDVVHAQIVELDLHELGRDLGRGVETERIGPLEVGLRLLQLIRRWARPIR